MHPVTTLYQCLNALQWHLVKFQEENMQPNFTLQTQSKKKRNGSIFPHIFLGDTVHVVNQIYTQAVFKH